MTVKIIDNLFSKNDIPEGLENLICNTIIQSLKNENNYEYTEEELLVMISRKNPNKIKDSLHKSLFLYIEEEGEIAAFSAINTQGETYFFTWIQVLPKFRGKGYAQILSNHKESILKEKNINQVYIESFIFENTINFHLKRGFKFIGNQEGLEYTLRMFKDL